MKKMKVMTILGTRPEIIRLSRVISLLDAETDHILVHTGQNYDYELYKVFFEDLGLKEPKHYLDVVGSSLGETIGNIIAKVDAVLETEKPDALLVLGDTNSCLSVIPAKRRKIPIFHMEAGNRCFDQRVPEETNRKIVDHVSDINMPYSEIAREYLLREGIAPDRIIKTGSPMKEVLDHYHSRIADSKILNSLGLDKGKFIVVSCHREENVDNDARLLNLVSSLNELAKTYDMPIIMSTHPRTRKRFEAKAVVLDPRVQVLKPMGFSDYVSLQNHSFVTVSDSGTITEESSILGFAAVNIRESHERPEGMEEAVVPLAGLEPQSVLNCVHMVTKRLAEKRIPKIVDDYDVSSVSEKVLNIILSYTHYVRRVVWQQ